MFLTLAETVPITPTSERERWLHTAGTNFRVFLAQAVSELARMQAHDRLERATTCPSYQNSEAMAAAFSKAVALLIVS